MTVEVEMMVEDGIIATNKGRPVFIYDNNVILPFTDISTKVAGVHKGRKVRCEITSYYPNDLKARIIDFLDDKDPIGEGVEMIKSHFDKLREELYMYEVPFEKIRLLFYAGYNAGLRGEPSYETLEHQLKILNIKKPGNK